MSIDQIARDAGAATREAVQQELDVEACLATLHATHRRRRQTTVATIAVACAAVVAAVVGVVSLPGTAPDQPHPATPVAPRCGIDTSSVKCAGDDGYAVEGVAPYSFHLPRQGFSRSLDVTRAPHMVIAYQDGSETRAGVTILDGAYPVRPNRGGTSAQELARWVTTHQHLLAGPVERTVVGGLAAWRVDVRVPARRDLPVNTWCNVSQNNCLRLLRAGAGMDWEVGPWRGMVSRFLFVQAADGQTVVIWSWTFNHDLHALDVNDEVIRTIDFRSGN